MTENDNGWISFAITTATSMGAVALGTLIRYFHQARHKGTKVQWARLKYEAPTVVGLTIVAVPVARYLSKTFAVEEGVLAATCLCLGYVGTRILDLFPQFLEKETKDEPSKD